MEISSIGLGTYLGDPGAAADAGYADAARAFAAAGGTVFDSAANYRMGRSERALGRAFRDLERASFFVSTKAGYLPMGDGVTAESPRAWFQRVLAGPGVLSPEDVVDNCHAMTPRYLAHQLGVSLQALGVACTTRNSSAPAWARPGSGPSCARPSRPARPWCGRAASVLTAAPPGAASGCRRRRPST